MDPKEYDFSFPRGDTCPVSFNLTDKNGHELNISTDTEIYFTLKKSYNTKEYVLQKKYSKGNITVNGKEIKFTLSHKDTAELPFGTYVYDVQFVSGDFVTTLLKGTIELQKESTWINNE